MADTQSYAISSSKMPKLQKLRDFLSERLTAAALEIFGAVEETLCEYQGEISRLQRLLDLVSQPEIKLNQLQDTPQTPVPDAPQPYVPDTPQPYVPDAPQVSVPDRPQTSVPEDLQEQWTIQEQWGRLEAEIEAVTVPPLSANEHSSLPPLVYQRQPAGSADSPLPPHHYTLAAGNRGGNTEIKTEPEEELCGPLRQLGDSAPFSGFAVRPKEESEQCGAPLGSRTAPSQRSRSFQRDSSSTRKWPSASALPTRVWPAHFSVDWDRMSDVIQNAVASRRRPLPVDRRQMVRMVVDQMREHDLNPSRAICLKVAQSIVAEYPDSFSDVREDGAATNTYASLLSQIKTRVEHVNRHNNLARRRRGRRPRSRPGEAAGEAAVCRGPDDRYGCVRWQPESLPPGETEDTLEDLRRRMVEMHSQEQFVEEEQLGRWLELTYVLQRRLLNDSPTPPIAEVRGQWPFLFSPSGLSSHFHLLTAVPIQAKLPEAMEGSGQKILQFFRVVRSNAAVEEVLAASQESDRNDTAVVIVLLLLAHFREPDWGLFLQANPSSTAADVEISVPLPDTPRLILQGETLMTPTAWMLSIQGQVVMGPHTDIVHGLAALFASYYIFNILYPPEAACTLEFIQRGLVGINPETGSRAAVGKVVSGKTGKVVEKKRTSMNPHVCTLLRKLMDFECLEVQPQFRSPREQEFDSLPLNPDIVLT